MRSTRPAGFRKAPVPNRWSLLVGIDPERLVEQLANRHRRLDHAPARLGSEASLLPTKALFEDEAQRDSTVAGGRLGHLLDVRFELRQPVVNCAFQLAAGARELLETQHPANRSVASPSGESLT